MTTTYRQWSTLRMVFHEHPSYPKGLITRRDSAATSIESPDIIQCTIHKDIGQAAGGFTATLVPRQEYLSSISPNDWVEIFLDNGDGSKEPVMVASVDSISRRRQVNASTGTTTEVISLQGRDYGKVLIGIQLVVDPLFGRFIDQTQFAAKTVLERTAQAKTVTAAPNKILEELVKNYHTGRAQCVLPGSLLFELGRRTKATVEDGLVLNLSAEVRGRSVLVTNVNLSGNLWSLMESFANSLLNEFWVDTVDGVPMLTLHERPYSHEAFAALKSVEVDATEVTHEDFGKSDTDTKNWFRVYVDAHYLSESAVDSSKYGYINQLSMQRSGLRKLDPHTSFCGDLSKSLTAEDGFNKGELDKWARVLAEWNAHNDLLLNGTLTTRLRPDAKVGRRLDYTNNRSGELLSFFIERVTHTFQYPGASTTSFSLTRGVERESTRASSSLSFPLLNTTKDLETIKEGLQLTPTEQGDYPAAAPTGTALV